MTVYLVISLPKNIVYIGIWFWPTLKHELLAAHMQDFQGIVLVRFLDGMRRHTPPHPTNTWATHTLPTCCLSRLTCRTSWAFGSAAPGWHESS